MSDTADAARSVAQANLKDLPWWKGAVIYQIYPRSFRDSNNDGIGDLRGILDGLDHISSLGVDGIWVSPFFTSPMADYGYDVADFCGVDPIFGTLEDFDAIVEAAHARDLKVIIDQVYSHTSDHHDWFIESRSSRDNPRADWYVWADPKSDGSPPNNWQSVFGGPSWEWDARRGQYYFHNFLKEQPDLNVYNPEVQEALINAGKFWLDRGVDGFRLDALNFAMHDRQLRDNPASGVSAHEATRPFDMQVQKYSMSQPEVVDFIEKFRAMLDAYPGTFTVAEVGGPTPIDEMKAFTEGETRLNSAYNFDFLYAPELDAARVERSAKLWDQSDGEGWPSWAFSNHDAPRAVTRWADSAHIDEMARLYMMLLLTLRGNPIIYQGEELGLPQARVPFSSLKDPEAIINWPKTLGRDGARTPMPWQADALHAGFSEAEPWLPMDPDHAARAIDQQQGNDSMLRFTAEALTKRKRHESLMHGGMRFGETQSSDVLVVYRDSDADAVTAIFNFGNAPVQLTEGLVPEGDLLLSSRPLNQDLLSSGKIAERAGVWISAK